MSRASTRGRRGLAAVFMSLLALVSRAAPSHAEDGPEFSVVRQFDDIELRDYAAYTVAEVTVPGPADAAGRAAFPILAGYIFGKNTGERRFAMTAPVSLMPLPSKLDRDAPVTRSATPGGFVVQFALPRGVTTASAPTPADARVSLREVAARRLAVIRYTGFWTAANDGKHLAMLQAALRAAGLPWSGEAVYARYNAPFTPWFVRRNEIWLQLAGPS